MIQPSDGVVTRERLLRAQLKDDEVVDAVIVLDKLGSAMVTSERIMAGAMPASKPGATSWGVLSIPWRLVTAIEVMESDTLGASKVCVTYERPSLARRGTSTFQNLNTAVWTCEQAIDAQRLGILIAARFGPS